MAVKAIFFDIDGTLLTDNRTIETSTIQAINQLKNQGYLVGLATARGPKFSLPYMASLRMDLAICYNGQYIISREGPIFTQAISKDNLMGLIDYGVTRKRDLSFATANDVLGSRLLHVGLGMNRFFYWIAKKLPHFMVNFLIMGFNQIYRRLKPQTKESILVRLKEPIYQVIMLAGEQETNMLAQQFPELKFTRGSPFAADIITRGMSKLKGIAIAGEHYGFTVSQVMVFGDSDNDIEMLSGAGYGVAMGNASHRVKERARYVTTSNNKSGIASALLHYGLIKE